MPAAKICGVTGAAALDAALAGGARYIGLVFFPKSPRRISLADAAALVSKTAGRAEIVAVTVDASDNELAAIAQTVRPDWIQLHGAEDPARAHAARMFALRGTIKAIPVASARDLDLADEYAPTTDLLLFDAKAPKEADRPGGLGASFDWGILSGRSFRRPWFLSGGLTPANVEEAVKVSGAALVDASSGLESAPGVKDPGRIAAFLAAARALEPV